MESKQMSMCASGPCHPAVIHAGPWNLRWQTTVRCGSYILKGLEQEKMQQLWP